MLKPGKFETRALNWLSRDMFGSWQSMTHAASDLLYVGFIGVHCHTCIVTISYVTNKLTFSDAKKVTSTLKSY